MGILDYALLGEFLLFALRFVSLCCSAVVIVVRMVVDEA